MAKHTSHSRIQKWDFCPFYDYLRYEKGIRLDYGNEHSVFGNSVHDTVAAILLKKITKEEVSSYFRQKFKDMLSALPEQTKREIFRNPDSISKEENKRYRNRHRGRDLIKFTKERQETVKDMMKKGGFISWTAVQALNDKFPGYELLFVEQEINEPIVSYENSDWDFRGFLDIGIAWEGKFIIIDWKNCDWGWGIRKKTDKIITNQLAYYKHFGCAAFGQHPNNTETYFALCKRGAFKKKTKNGTLEPKKNIIEFVKVSTGPRKIKNALKILHTHLYNVDHQRHIKNRQS